MSDLGPLFDAGFEAGYRHAKEELLKRLREPDDGLVDVVWGMLPPDCNTAVSEFTNAIATHLDQERSRE
jgi:hypothetical protein